MSIIIITITHQNGDAWWGIFSALSISTTNAEVKNYFQLVKSANISNMYQTSDYSQPHCSLHLQQNGEETLVCNLGMNLEMNSKCYL